MTEVASMALTWSLIGVGGSVRAPLCCDLPMEDEGDCGQGCCDDFRCARCGHRLRVEWPD